MKNFNRKLKFVWLNINIFKLIIFIDIFFVNNIDFIFQINYVIYLIDVSNKTNIIYWTFIKCKRMIKNVLISKLYVMI